MTMMWKKGDWDRLGTEAGACEMELTNELKERPTRSDLIDFQISPFGNFSPRNFDDD